MPEAFSPSGLNACAAAMKHIPFATIFPASFPTKKPKQWEQLIRGHWGGVENRNHWKKDAIWREDATPSRNPNLVGNLALLRNALFVFVVKEGETHNTLTAFTEAMQADHSLTFNLITSHL